MRRTASESPLIFAGFFEQAVKTQEENYQQWDDYIEWRAYLHMLEDISRKMSAITNADFEVN